ncbi:MAG: FMN reductase [Firmicutes bacterium HGW-Firmicutes-3]|jgi:multimeric flavodoxin WrbA|nr:MAG: FMN reductase [Firmicutes bacterium HGW-Firmicutes-3]
MKIVGIVGSMRKSGNTLRLMEEAIKPFAQKAEVDIIELNQLDFSGCIGCEGCSKTYRCVLKDDLAPIYALLDQADGFILASPTYFYNITSKMKAFIERLYPYQIFDDENRHIWTSVFESKRIKYGITISICEQEDEKDMGFTSKAMSMPLEGLGVRVVENVKVLNLFGREEADQDQVALKSCRDAGEKLLNTLLLLQRIRSIQ